MIRPTVLAYFFPNWHVDPRNQQWFGDTWTEWDLLREAKPRFPGHRQPRVPAFGETDESDPREMARQISLARGAGIDGFQFDFYWYEDGPYLQGALDRGFLEAENSTDLDFCLMWANHNLLNIFPARQAVPPSQLAAGAISRQAFEKMTDHIVEAYFSRPNYLKIDGRPWFAIYEVASFVAGMGGLVEAREALDAFDAKVRRAGHPGVHLDALMWGHGLLPGALQERSLTSVIHDLGFHSASSYVWIHHVDFSRQAFPVGDWDGVADEAFAEYERYAQELSIPFHPNVTVGWDSSPRATSEEEFRAGPYPWVPVYDATPDQFARGLARAKEFVARTAPATPIVHLNAWNEWSEGSALMPDTVNGMRVLEKLAEAFPRAD